ncbi:hypothetical protein N7462_009637 [Penicillium macrosclerotiorum]|uniref:uncharacterized protein n=1 Tax=Penicillium macrosclerotiorum TaxID=303699 RepID=UPI0025470944|nr:uncharacterized protein N7462_009637 [Penicillium macrosclerotiorum]KAJ5674198.1 hypothetical protein N7462_009637 [Penicillium macrosclerotiorum]
MTAATPVAEYTQIELLTLHGAEFRRVSTAPPRLPTEDEIPIIDLSTIDDGFEARKLIAARVRSAAKNTGFFYIRNHGIPEDLIQKALEKAQAFFDQTNEQKNLVSSKKSKDAVGFHSLRSTQINKSETRDRKETFSMRYNPAHDPRISDSGPFLANEAYAYGNDEFLWEGTQHIPGFREITIEFWQRRLSLARKIIRIFALALDMPEDYFDAVTTHPGADGLYVHYPGSPESGASEATLDVGIGSHTDIQCITLLWQDNSGGLQVLSASDEWLDTLPIPNTLVVNIGDFLQRLSNNMFRSTVHRVYNRQTTSRYSMPFFFGFNPDSVCKVVTTCIDEEHPALFEPISCGEVSATLLFHN